jgi:hypothetical protein
MRKTLKQPTTISRMTVDTLLIMSQLVGCQWLILVILANQEAEIRRI